MPPTWRAPLARPPIFGATRKDAIQALHEGLGLEAVGIGQHQERRLLVGRDAQHVLPDPGLGKYGWHLRSIEMGAFQPHAGQSAPVSDRPAWSSISCPPPMTPPPQQPNRKALSNSCRSSSATASKCGACSALTNAISRSGSCPPRPRKTFPPHARRPSQGECRCRRQTPSACAMPSVGGRKRPILASGSCLVRCALYVGSRGSSAPSSVRTVGIGRTGADQLEATSRSASRSHCCR